MKYFVVCGSYDVTTYRKLWKNPKNIILKRKSSHCMMYKVWLFWVEKMLKGLWLNLSNIIKCVNLNIIYQETNIIITKR